MSTVFHLIRESFIDKQPLFLEIIKSREDELHISLMKHGFTMIHPVAATKKTPDYIIRQVLNCFEIVEEDVELQEDLCRKFLKSLRFLRTPEAMDLSSQLKEEWKSKALELKMSGFSLTDETSHKEEVEILKRSKVKPFVNSQLKKKEKQEHPVYINIVQNRYHRNSYEPTASPRYQRETCLNNNAALEFEKHYTTIVHIICDKKLFSKIANRLCEARLVLASVVDQAHKMTVPVMQAKAIMGSVHTMIKRGVKPDIILQNLISVLNLSDFHDTFKCVVKDLKQQSYNPSKFTKGSLICQNSKVEMSPTTKDNGSTIVAPVPVLVSSLSTSSGGVAPTTTVTVAVGSAHAGDDEYQTYLRSRYRRLKDVSTSYTAGFTSKQRKIELKFFDLAANINGNADVLDLACLPQYDPVTETKRTLIYGNSGVGKSSIINNLCKGWSNNSLLRKYKYVILLKASDPNVCTANKLKDLLPEETRDWIRIGRETLFILDAYDEFSEESRSEPNGFFNQLLQGKVFGSELVSLIVTARPWCAKEISDHFTNEVEILGFTPESRVEYIKHHLPDKDAEKFLSHPPMVQCTSIPFLLATLIEIFDELMGDETGGASANIIPTTITSLFESVIRSLIFKFSKSNDKLSKYMHGNINVPLRKFSSCLPPEIYEPFLEICSIAYKTLLMPSLDIPFRSDQITFGLVTVDTELHCAGQKKCYKFLHSFIQEFLAAFCISRMEKDQREDCIKSLQVSPFRYQLMIEFLYGFGCINEIDCTKYKAYQVVTNFNILRQLCESPHSEELIKSVYDRFSRYSRKPCLIKRTYPSPSFADFWCLGRVIALSGCEWELGFTKRPIQNEHIEMLCKGFESIHNPKSRIKKFGFSLTKIDKKGIECICQMSKVHLQNVTEAQFSANSLTSSVIPILSKAIDEKKFRNLQKFLIYHNVIIAGGHMELIIALGAHCPNIEHVAFTELQPREYIALIELRKLKVIELWRVSSRCVEESFRNLPMSRSVQQLEVYQTKICREVVEILPHTLPQSSITCLKLINCNIYCELVAIIARAVRDRLRCMQRYCKMSIDLSDNIIRDSGREILFQLQHEGCDILDSYKCNEFTMPNGFGEIQRRPDPHYHHQSRQYRRHQPHAQQRDRYIDHKRYY